MNIHVRKISHDVRRGFTLIELLVVVTVIAVLMAAGVVSYTNAGKKSRDSKRISDLGQIAIALEMYRADSGYYPSAGSGSAIDIGGGANSTFNTQVVTPGYMTVIPDDPQPSSYTYYYQATGGAGSPTQYYGYCLSAKREGGTASTQCTVGASGYNYSIKNP